MRVVLLDPDALTAKLVRFVLNEAGHDVDWLPEAGNALPMIAERETDAVLLEAELPGVDAFALCRELRGHRYNGPLLFLTARRETRDKLQAFASGADDYIVEPFDPAELVARIDAVARRYRRADYQSLGSILTVGDAELTIGELSYRVGDSEKVLLTPTEMRLLECLMRNAGITISRDTLIERTWGYDFIGESNRVDVYVARLRRKIERYPAHPEYLHTVRGLGYVFRPPVQPAGRRSLSTPRPWDRGVPAAVGVGV